MLKSDIVKRAINHKETQIQPFSIMWERAFTRYGKQLYADYADANSRRITEDCGISDEYAVNFGIGNFIYQCGCPWWDWYNLGSDWSGFDAPTSRPNSIGRGSYEGYAERLAKIREQTGCYILVTIWGSHFEKAYFARGIENFLADMAGEPEFAQDLLNTIIHKNMVMLENIANIPAIDGILLGSDWGSQKSMLMAPDVWRKLISAGEKKEYDYIKSCGKDVWVHSCGNIQPILGDLADLGVQVLNPLQPECMDIAKIKAEHGDRLSFWGGISTQQTLPYGSTADVKNDIINTCSIMNKGGGFVLAPSQGLQDDVPYENIQQFIATARELAGM